MVRVDSNDSPDAIGEANRLSILRPHLDRFIELTMLHVLRLPTLLGDPGVHLVAGHPISF